MGRLSRGATDFLKEFSRNEEIMHRHAVLCELNWRYNGRFAETYSPITFAVPVVGIQLFRCGACGWFKWEDHRGQ